MFGSETWPGSAWSSNSCKYKTSLAVTGALSAGYQGPLLAEVGGVVERGEALTVRAVDLPGGGEEKGAQDDDLAVCLHLAELKIKYFLSKIDISYRGHVVS